MGKIGIDKTLYKKMIEKNAQRRGMFRYPKKGSTHLRIVKYGDAGMFSVEVPQHQRRDFGSNKDRLGICPKSLKNQPCAVCKVNEQAIAEGAEAPFPVRYKYAVNAIDVNEDANRIQLWLLPSSVHDDIVNVLLEDEWEDALEPDTGVCFTIKREGTGLDTSYTVTPQRKPYKVNKKLFEQAIDPLEKLTYPTLEAQCESLGVDLSDLFTEDELETVETDTKKQKKGKVTSIAKAKFEVGDEVFYQNESETCKVTEVGAMITIEDVNGDPFEVEPEDLKPSEDEPEPEQAGSGEIEVGSPVKYLDEEGMCMVKSIEGQDVEIEDESGDVYDVELNDLTLAEEEPVGDEEITEECIVRFQEEKGTCKVTSINGDDVEIEDGKGDVYDAVLGDLTFVQGDDSNWPF